MPKKAFKINNLAHPYNIPTIHGENSLDFVSFV